MRFGARIARFSSSLSLLFSRNPSHLRRNLSSSATSAKACRLNNECGEFLPWLQQKAGSEISSVLFLGNSIFGKSLYASRSIQAGDCVLKVPYSAQITLDMLPLEISQLLLHGIDNVSQLALVLMAEQKLGAESEWAPYINSLPHMDEMHNTIFWSKDELCMIHQSPVYKETLEQKEHIEKEYSAIQPVLDQFPQMFGDTQLENFMHAYALVSSRAWRTSKGVSLIPFADFLNHDGMSDSVLLSDDSKEISEVIADRNYAVDEEVMIRYGKFSNATLLLDFGFTLPHNIHDQVQLIMDIPSEDPLYVAKLELLHRHCLLKSTNSQTSKTNNTGSSFIIKEVRSRGWKGKGIPQALRAFARVLSATSLEELREMTCEAAENDGRLARRPLKNKDREIRAHCILLSQLNYMIQGHDAAIEMLNSCSIPETSSHLSIRRKMGRDLLAGELRVLQSAHDWLTNHCASLRTQC
ncbi:fructose-bisphosphate aldolase-lysine N-methyltransferase, chloroplastic isoform X1 [Typha angustifolia]|uniref:fructose-bisphosphate aldolase-lysine N-methyltransferase, chloroplastic isoform X1 n=1 Tax=Typha angustifolia TaxID=59011 RepID=UPI003C2E035E